MSYVLLIALFLLNIVIVYKLTLKVIDAIQSAVTVDRSRIVYEDEAHGSLTVYRDDAILELLDGTVIVFPRMETAEDN